MCDRILFYGVIPNTTKRFRDLFKIRDKRVAHKAYVSRVGLTEVAKDDMFENRFSPLQFTVNQSQRRLSWEN